MNKYKETFNTWNKLAGQYAEKFMDLPIYNASYDFICETIQTKNAKLLEIGCGPGNITKYLLSKRPDFKILGLDVAPNMIEIARKSNPAATFEVKDVRMLEDLNDRYDGVIGGFCLPYLSSEDTEKLINDAYNLLNKEGLLYLSFVDGDPSASKVMTGSTGDKMFFNYHRLSDIKGLLEKNNFVNIRSMEVEFQRSENSKELHTIVTSEKNTWIK